MVRKKTEINIRLYVWEKMTDAISYRFNNVDKTVTELRLNDDYRVRCVTQCNELTGVSINEFSGIYKLVPLLTRLERIIFRKGQLAGIQLQQIKNDNVKELFIGTDVEWFEYLDNFPKLSLIAFCVPIKDFEKRKQIIAYCKAKVIELVLVKN
jgi:hypothetical protein